MLEQREKVCKVCKAADNRGLLPSRSAEHGLVPEVLSPVMTLDKTKNGLTIQECHNGINIAKGKGGEDQISKKFWSSISFKSLQVSQAKNLSSFYISNSTYRAGMDERLIAL